MLRFSARLPTLETRSRFALLAMLASLLILVVACQPKSPEEQVAAARAQYSVELKSWFPREPEPEPVMEDAEGEATEGEETEGEEAEDESAEGDASETEGEDEGNEEGDEEIVEPAGPQMVKIYFDLVVLYRGDSPLPGLTLDVSQAGADGHEKKAWRHYVELPDHINGQTMQVGFTSDEVEFAEGDQFSVVLEKNVSPEEYSEYQEFQSAAP